ncbi:MULTISPECIES: hypothetical protein [unclassified Flavobacterium]|uniref:hypothetical protein n=1 Tax=unclassified Flavobacterium TaxID=196869 RepID=UPI001F13B3BD|nr:MULTISPECIES: hypothetical protein [unclassified Flavobacterium]UMY64456.1 hypothetical protein MKO97_08025 [Flavobacterium sp. HJ-32-4]
MRNEVVLFTLQRIMALAVAGAVIGVLHQDDLTVAFLLAAYSIVVYLRKKKMPGAKLYFLGYILSALGGVMAEHWGISNGHWTYHDLSDGRTFPYWLPFAWGLAFTFLYSFERAYILAFRIRSFGVKFCLTLLVSALFPTIGEIVTVKLGVWTYHWPYQVLGIPLYAIGLLMAFHSGMYLLLCWTGKRWRVSDPVFGRTPVETL